MSTKAKRHTHKYFKVDIGGQQLWACALPDCNHYMPKHLENLVVGKGSICWECSSNMVLNPKNMERNKPICNDCSGLTSIENKLEDMLMFGKTMGIKADD